MPNSSAPVITSSQLLDHWQGHRALTRRVIDAFPEDQLFSFTLGSMRSFGAIIQELLGTAGPAARGLATGDWGESFEREAAPKSELLRMWDETTEEINRYWPQIDASRFQEEMTAFGQWPGTGWFLLLYVIDNEIHHRGQGYVYLRALGIEPPPFYER